MATKKAAAKKTSTPKGATKAQADRAARQAVREEKALKKAAESAPETKLAVVATDPKAQSMKNPDLTQQVKDLANHEADLQNRLDKAEQAHREFVDQCLQACAGLGWTHDGSDASALQQVREVAATADSTQELKVIRRQLKELLKAPDVHIEVEGGGGGPAIYVTRLTALLGE